MERRCGRVRPPERQEWVQEWAQPAYYLSTAHPQAQAACRHIDGSQQAAAYPCAYWLNHGQHFGSAFVPQVAQHAWSGHAGLPPSQCPFPPPPPPPPRAPRHQQSEATDQHQAVAAAGPAAAATGTAGPTSAASPHSSHNRGSSASGSGSAGDSGPAHSPQLTATTSTSVCHTGPGVQSSGHCHVYCPPQYAPVQHYVGPPQQHLQAVPLQYLPHLPFSGQPAFAHLPMGYGGCVVLTASHSSSGHVSTSVTAGAQAATAPYWQQGGVPPGWQQGALPQREGPPLSRRYSACLIGANVLSAGSSAVAGNSLSPAAASWLGSAPNAGVQARGPPQPPGHQNTREHSADPLDKSGAGALLPHSQRSAKGAQPLSRRHHSSEGQDAAAVGGEDSGSESGDFPLCSSAAAAVSPNFKITPDDEAVDWSTLTEGLLQRIVLRLASDDTRVMRLVGRHWRAVVDHNLEQLSPNVMCSVVIVTRFSNLRALHLTSCANVRNRDLMIIAKSRLRLHTLTLGDDTTKPWVTNRGLAFIALQDITTLTSLNLFGCIRVGDEGLAPLAGLKLVTLTLGMTRIRDAGVQHLAAITTLQELAFSHEEMTDAGLKQLSGLSNLQSLALREVQGLSGEALVEVVPRLSKLQALDLFRNGSFRDDQLRRCLDAVASVTSLDLRGTSVTQAGIQQLSQLVNLQKLCVQPPHVNMWEPYMLVLANLTQLVSLTINNCTVLSMRLLGSLRPLNRLVELDLSDDKFLDSLRPRDAVQTQHVEVMASLSSLTSLDLSRRPIGESHLVVLAERLPRLRSLIVVGCPVDNVDFCSLQRRFPELAIHRKPLGDGSSCSSSEVNF